MRLLFLFLVLVNGFIYLWYSFHAEEAVAKPVVQLPDVPRLVLVSEANTTSPASDSDKNINITATSQDIQPTSTSTTTGKGKQGQTVTSCYTLGPFMNEDSVYRAAEKLMISGRPFEKRASEKKELTGYRVFIPPLKTVKAAQAKARQLKEAGDKHHYVVKKHPKKGRTSTLENAISLGVFGVKKNAERRMAQVEKMGHTVKIEGVYRENPVYWIDFTEQESNTPLDSSSFVGAQQLPRVCENIASSKTLP